MVRWEPGTRDRLRQAALELYLERGFEATSVQQIAARAGVTERTYFRHFPDKREVLFDSEDQLGRAFTDGIGAAEGAPMTLVAAGLDAAARVFPGERRPWSRARQTVIDANPALREREMLKLDTLGTTLADALRTAGVPEPTASVAAQSALSTFRVAFGRWIAEDETRELADIQHALLDEWRSLARG